MNIDWHRLTTNTCIKRQKDGSKKCIDNFNVSKRKISTVTSEDLTDVSEVTKNELISTNQNMECKEHMGKMA